MNILGWDSVLYRRWFKVWNTVFLKLQNESLWGECQRWGLTHIFLMAQMVLIQMVQNPMLRNIT